jgi:DNA-binding IclR family transcriptional regulator
MKPTLDLEFDEDRGSLIVRISVVVTDEKKSMVAAIKTSTTQKKIDEAEAKKKLKALVTAVAKGAGKDAATEIAKAAKDR